MAASLAESRWRRERAVDHSGAAASRPRRSAASGRCAAIGAPPQYTVRMSTPQPGILPEQNRFAYFLVLSCDSAPAASAGLGAAARIAAEVAALAPDAGLVLNVGVGSRLWDLLEPGRRP